ncbi:DsbE family thiol:disulfide interchange protein [Marinobacter sp. CHS3-4]|uniref:DsbE family thiol:disulfide interchange protein n=1 Tax=Marinobacter sp. CHS3-4 TaxID=3045174 RepID=UPI0024B5FF4A|nr:DsbE family thiol:disulfide interchange protein [Marinobacter sp. CHS3-4]MDI9245872.1 DsbE family thiol:disulfide interchange protein [Marinobacter sp. CHS3-4]
MKRALMFLPVVLVVALGAILFAGIGKDPNRLESALIGKPVPEFNLADLQAPDSQHDQSLFKGQVSLLNVWGTWCPACRDEHDDLIWLAREKGVRIVGLNYKDDRQEALKWLKTLGDPYAVSVYDPRGTLGFDLGVYGAPETYFIDSQGIVRYRHVGVVNETVWNEKFLPLMEEYGDVSS